MPASGKFDIGEDIAQQRRVWLLERIGWALMSVIVLLTLLGFTGHGHFSERHAGSTDAGLVVSYNRFERYAAPTLLRVSLADGVEGETRLRLSQEFLQKVEVLRVDPQPERVELGTEFLTYVFNVSAPGTIVYHYEPASIGPLPIGIGLDGRALQTLSLFVYP